MGLTADGIQKATGLTIEPQPGIIAQANGTSVFNSITGEIGYNQITSNVNVTSTTEATGTTVITASAYTFPGSVVIAEFFSPAVAGPAVSGAATTLSLFEGTTQVGRLAEVESEASTHAVVPVHSLYRFTPSAGTHTYSITGFVDSGTGIVLAGAGGTGAFVPSFLRFTVA